MLFKFIGTIKFIYITLTTLIFSFLKNTPITVINYDNYLTTLAYNLQINFIVNCLSNRGIKPHYLIPFDVQFSLVLL